MKKIPFTWQKHKVKPQVRSWEKIFARYVTDKELTFLTYKELLQIEEKKKGQKSNRKVAKT